MPRQMDLGEVLARNPQIDRSRLDRSTDLLRRLRDMGLRRKEYDLASPFGGRRAFAQDGARAEPRLGELTEVHEDE